jgi:hypothetical protein
MISILAKKGYSPLPDFSDVGNLLRVRGGDEYNGIATIYGRAAASLFDRSGKVWYFAMIKETGQIEHGQCADR